MKNKELPSAEQLGLVQLHYNRYREIGGWREVIFWPDPIGLGLHIEPYKASYLYSSENRGGVSLGTFDLVRETVQKAVALGYDAWMCDNDPRNGGYVKAKAI